MIRQPSEDVEWPDENSEDDLWTSTSVQIVDRRVESLAGQPATTPIGHITRKPASFFKSPGKMQRMRSMIERGKISQGNAGGKATGFAAKRQHMVGGLFLLFPS